MCLFLCAGAVRDRRKGPGSVPNADRLFRRNTFSRPRRLPLTKADTDRSHLQQPSSQAGELFFCVKQRKELGDRAVIASASFRAGVAGLKL